MVNDSSPISVASEFCSLRFVMTLQNYLLRIIFLSLQSQISFLANETAKVLRIFFLEACWFYPETLFSTSSDPTVRLQKTVLFKLFTHGPLSYGKIMCFFLFLKIKHIFSSWLQINAHCEEYRNSYLFHFDTRNSHPGGRKINWYKLSWG